jgi:hypothetical protein
VRLPTLRSAQEIDMITMQILFAKVPKADASKVIEMKN